mgnify:CR=1 FL=1|tara:strand:+ start:812 stop:1477 length:666 start_codon:yes stop_codon:yes gene_type:complete
MVDFRNILERGKSNYTVVFKKLSPKNNGVFKAAYNYINDSFPILEKEDIPADDVDTILSTTIGGMLFGVSETYKKFDFSDEESEIEAELDLDGEDNPYEIPDDILSKIKDLAEDVIEEELPELAKKLAEQINNSKGPNDPMIDSEELMEAFKKVLSLSSATNLMGYLLGLTASFYYNQAEELEGADERKEPLPRVKFDESGFSSSFQDEFKMEKWFDNLRK